MIANHALKKGSKLFGHQRDLMHLVHPHMSMGDTISERNESDFDIASIRGAMFQEEKNRHRPTMEQVNPIRIKQLSMHRTTSHLAAEDNNSPKDVTFMKSDLMSGDGEDSINESPERGLGSIGLLNEMAEHRQDTHYHSNSPSGVKTKDRFPFSRLQVSMHGSNGELGDHREESEADNMSQCKLSTNFSKEDNISHPGVLKTPTYSHGGKTQKTVKFHLKEVSPSLLSTDFLPYGSAQTESKNSDKS